MLIEGIKTDELDTPIGQVWASDCLQENFDECVTLFQQYIKDRDARKTTNKSITIAAVGTGKRKRDDDAVEPDMSMEDRYYNVKEYRKLSPAKKYALKILREKRGGGSGKGSAKKHKRSVELSDRTVKAIVTALKTMDVSEPAATVPEVEEVTVVTSNRTNKALQRKQA